MYAHCFNCKVFFVNLVSLLVIIILKQMTANILCHSRSCFFFHYTSGQNSLVVLILGFDLRLRGDSLTFGTGVLMRLFGV